MHICQLSDIKRHVKPRAILSYIVPFLVIVMAGCGGSRKDFKSRCYPFSGYPRKIFSPQFKFVPEMEIDHTLFVDDVRSIITQPFFGSGVEKLQEAILV